MTSRAFPCSVSDTRPHSIRGGKRNDWNAIALEIGSRPRGRQGRAAERRRRVSHGNLLPTGVSNSVLLSGRLTRTSGARPARRVEDSRAKWCACDRQTYCVNNDSEGSVEAEQNLPSEKCTSVPLPFCRRASAPHAACQSSFFREIVSVLGNSESGRFPAAKGLCDLPYFRVHCDLNVTTEAPITAPLVQSMNARWFVSFSVAKWQFINLTQPRAYARENMILRTLGSFKWYMLLIVKVRIIYISVIHNLFELDLITTPVSAKNLPIYSTVFVLVLKSSIFLNLFCYFFFRVYRGCSATGSRK